LRFRGRIEVEQDSVGRVDVVAGGWKASNHDIYVAKLSEIVGRRMEGLKPDYKSQRF
jgi:hypothetical protein